MEHENFAGRGTTGLAATAMAVGGTALAATLFGENGIISRITGGCRAGRTHEAYENTGASKYDLAMQARIAELETEVKLRDANTFTLGEMNNFRNYVDEKFDAINAQLCQQNVYNATNTAAIGCIQAQVAQLMSLTKVVIPNGSICPGWGNVTVTPTTTTA